MVQECFIKCFRYLPDFKYSRTIGRFRAWLNLVVNQQMVQLSRGRVKDERARAAWRQLVLDSTPSAAKPATEVNAYEAELMALAFRRIQADVSARDWQIFEASLIHGLAAAEVGSRFDVSPGAIRLVIHRIRKRLRREWIRLQNAPF